jgi:Protein of unknown function (DUF2508).
MKMDWGACKAGARRVRSFTRRWLRNWTRRGTTESFDRFDRDAELIREIEEAKKAWWIAQHRFHHVTDPDQIDYAVYAWEAAEKRYEMLLRTAKRAGVSRLDRRTGRAMEV